LRHQHHDLPLALTQRRSVAIAIAAILGPDLRDLIIALVAMGWTGYARLVRGEVLSLREREYVSAARALGARPARLLFRHLLPGLTGPLAVQATFGVGGIIIAEAALSFLGVGVRPPIPSWGNMIDAGRAFILETPIDRPGDDRRNVRALWDLVGVSPKQAPKAENGFSMLKAKKKEKALTQRTQRARRKKKVESVKAKKRKR